MGFFCKLCSSAQRGVVNPVVGDRWWGQDGRNLSLGDNVLLSSGCTAMSLRLIYIYTRFGWSIARLSFHLFFVKKSRQVRVMNQLALVVTKTMVLP